MSPILILDDDQDDLNMLRDAAHDLGITRPILYFQTAPQLIGYLRLAPVKPFLIICDINMPIQNGFELKEQLNSDQQIPHKNIPFFYWTTGTSRDYINTAIKLNIDGYYLKPLEYSKLKETFALIIKGGLA